MSAWLDDLRNVIAAGTPAVLVTVAGARGSVPRGAGTKMIVLPERQIATIGGGRLEYRAAEIAREMLADATMPAPALKDFPLGPALGQCCGGHATLLFERIGEADRPWVEALTASLEKSGRAWLATELAGGAKLVVTPSAQSGGLGEAALDQAVVSGVRLAPPEAAYVTENFSAPVMIEPIQPAGTEIVLFGAGHVGAAIVNILSPVPDLRVTWIDDRAELLPKDPPASVTVVLSDDPVAEVEALPTDAHVLVMTHSHALDYDIVENVLRRGDFRFCGLIGSATKRTRFEQRFLHRGGSKAVLARLTSPIGIAGIEGKHPSEIAIAVAAEILQLRSRRALDESAREKTA